jgi:hypothetical protein
MEVDMNTSIAAFDFAQQTVTQTITLAIALIAITMFLSRDRVSVDGVTTLRRAWTALLLSVLFGILALGALAGQLTTSNPDLWGGPSIMAAIQLMFFIAGLWLSIRYKLRALSASATAK